MWRESVNLVWFLYSASVSLVKQPDLSIIFLFAIALSGPACCCYSWSLAWLVHAVGCIAVASAAFSLQPKAQDSRNRIIAQEIPGERSIEQDLRNRMELINQLLSTWMSNTRLGMGFPWSWQHQVGHHSLNKILFCLTGLPENICYSAKWNIFPIPKIHNKGDSCVWGVLQKLKLKQTKPQTIKQPQRIFFCNFFFPLCFSVGKCFLHSLGGKDD